VGLGYLSDAPDQLEPVHSRHAQVGDGEGWLSVHEYLQRIPPVVGRDYVVAVFLQPFIEESQNLRLIIDNQYFGRQHRHEYTPEPTGTPMFRTPLINPEPSRSIGLRTGASQEDSDGYFSGRI